MLQRRVKLGYFAFSRAKLTSWRSAAFFCLEDFSFFPGRSFQVFSYEVKGGSDLGGGRSSNEIRRLTKHYYLTKWRPQIKLLRLFNDFLPLFHVHVWYWLVLQFFLLFVRDHGELILSCNSFVLRFTSLDVCEILRDAVNSADAMNMLKRVKF